MEAVPQGQPRKRPVSSSVAPTPQGKGFASDETRFPAYETRLKQSACIVVRGSVLAKSLPGHSPPTPALGVDLVRTIRCPAAFFFLQAAETALLQPPIY
jgi:hypothetical protein